MRIVRMFSFFPLLLFLFVQTAWATKIAFVDTRRILRESRPSHEANRLLMSEFSDRLHHVKDLESRLNRLQSQMDDDTVSLTLTDRRKLERQYNALVSELHAAKHESSVALSVRRSEEYQRIINLANDVVRDLAVHNHYDAILQEAVYVNKKSDITDKVLERMSHISLSEKSDKSDKDLDQIEPERLEDR